MFKLFSKNCFIITVFLLSAIFTVSFLKTDFSLFPKDHYSNSKQGHLNVKHGISVNLTPARIGCGSIASVAITIEFKGDKLGDLFYEVNGKKIEPYYIESVLKNILSHEDVQQKVILFVDRRVPSGATVEILEMANRNNWTVLIAAKKK